MTEVERRTPPPKQRRQETKRGCRCRVLSDIKAGIIPVMKLPSPRASIASACAVVNSIFVGISSNARLNFLLKSLIVSSVT